MEVIATELSTNETRNDWRMHLWQVPSLDKVRPFTKSFMTISIFIRATRPLSIESVPVEFHGAESDTQPEPRLRQDSGQFGGPLRAAIEAISVPC
jgi:hypothetical protein